MELVSRTVQEGDEFHTHSFSVDRGERHVPSYCNIHDIIIIIIASIIISSSSKNALRRSSSLFLSLKSGDGNKTKKQLQTFANCQNQISRILMLNSFTQYEHTVVVRSQMLGPPLPRSLTNVRTIAQSRFCTATCCSSLLEVGSSTSWDR